MPIVDTHVHIMAPDQRLYPRQIPAEIQPQFGWARCDFSAESLIAAMDKAGIRRALLVQAFNAYRSDNSYVADMADKYPARFRQVCIQDAREPDALAKLDQWVGRGAVALRVMLQDKGYRLDDPRVEALIARAAKHRIPVCIYMLWDQINLVAPVLERHPDMPFALDHMASPPLEEGPPYASMAPLLDLARYPHLSLKFSSSTVYASGRAKSSTRAWFELLLERFGAGRLMWGSNFPMDNRRDIAGLLDMARQQLAFVSDADRDKLFGGNALIFFPALWPSASQ
jgi:L-fuconolactonase